MNLLINGFPKSGNHALKRACLLLGYDVQVNHLTYGPFLSDDFDKCIFIKRDPRNVIISFMRHLEITVTVENFITTCKRMHGMFDSDGIYIDKFDLFEDWLIDSQTYVVSYEALISSPDEMFNIAKHLDVAFNAGMWLRLERPTLTWKPVHSDYKAIWTIELNAFWLSSGGLELQQRWGYADA